VLALAIAATAWCRHTGSLRIPNFRRFILNLLTMNVATQLQSVVVSRQVYALTHDPSRSG